MSEEIRIDFMNPDGTLKKKEEFLAQMEELYGELETNTSQESPDFMTLFTAPEEHFSPSDTLDKYQFVERKLYINSEITSGAAPCDGPSILNMTTDTGHDILERIQFWNAEDAFNKTPIEERIPIQIYIDSPGGDLTTTFQIVDAIKNSKTPVYTIVTGTAFSGGFFIAIAGHKRYAFPNATFLCHEGSGGYHGDAHKAFQNMKYYEMLLNKLKNHTVGCTDISPDLYDKHKKDDWFFDAQKALKLGVIDKISNDVNGGLYEDEE